MDNKLKYRADPQLRRGFKTRGGAQQSKNMSSSVLKKQFKQKAEEFDEATSHTVAQKLLKEMRVLRAAYVASLPESADPDGSMEKHLIKAAKTNRSLLYKK